MKIKKISYLLIVLILIIVVGCKKSTTLDDIINTNYELLGTWDFSLTFDNGEKQTFEYFSQNTGNGGTLWHETLGDIGVFVIYPNGNIEIGVVYANEEWEIHYQSYVGKFKASSLIEGTFVYELEDSNDKKTVRQGTFIGKKK